MFIAMNRFQVKLGNEAEFERIWRERDIYLRDLPGFVEFHLLKGPKPSARRTRTPASTATSISAARISRASTSSRP